MLRAAGRVFLGWGPHEQDRFGADRAGPSEAPSIEGSARRPPGVLFIPAVALLAGGLALGLIPGLSGHLEQAAAEFQDRAAYTAAVLHARAAPAPTVPSEPPSAQGVIYGLASTAIAMAAASIALFRRRIASPKTRRAIRTVAPSLSASRETTFP